MTRPVFRTVSVSPVLDTASRDEAFMAAFRALGINPDDVLINEPITLTYTYIERG